MKEKGLVHIYSGEGKGKTTAALGLILRSLGRKKKVCLIQFFKPKNCNYGEHIAFEKKYSRLKIIRFKNKHPMFENCRKVNSKKLKDEMLSNYKIAEKNVLSNKFDLIVLDEILNVAVCKLISYKDIIELIKSKPKSLELVLTGRGNFNKLIKMADYVTQCKKIKHPFDKGIQARAGIEY